MERKRMNRLVLTLGALALVATAACKGEQKAVAAPQAPAARATVASAAPMEDLFAFASGAHFVQLPADANLHEMDSSPLNLIDENNTTDWTGEAKQPAVFVIELAERSALSRLAFDTAGLNRDEKAVKGLSVEISDTSATTGFQPALSVDLKPSTNNQIFNLPTKMTGRWVRLTVRTNVSNDGYFGMTGFRGYGEQLTHAASLAGVTGTYEGASGWGTVRLKQEGSRVTGCYSFENGVIAGGVDGRMLKVEMNADHAQERGVFIFSEDGSRLYGLSRAKDDSGTGYASYWSATKTGNDPGDCPAIPGFKGQAAKSQLSAALQKEGRARLDGVNFDFNSATIQPASYALLDQIVQMLKDNAGWQITLEGHTDNVGGAAFNKTLSAQRAAAVQAYLVKGGIPAGRLTSVGFGLEKPVASNDTSVGRAQNRRVEIVRQ
jgi:OOP family OmpA-OmpF porin